MVEVLRPTAIGRLEELDTATNSSEFEDEYDKLTSPLEEVGTISSVKRLFPYHHKVLLAASVYLEYIQGARSCPPQPTFFLSDPFLQRQTYKLALGAYHYLAVLEELLLETYFYSSYVQFRQCQPLVIVMMYNLKLLGFKAPAPYHCEFGEVIREVQDVHEALMKFKTKFHAAFARSRIKCNAYNEDLLLSVDIRLRYRAIAEDTPRYARVNTLKRNREQVAMILENRGYKKIAAMDSWLPYSFYIDPLLDDLLVFSPDSKDDLSNFVLVHDGSLVIQDKSDMVAAKLLNKMISTNGTSNDDIIVTDIDTGNAACYLATLQSREGSILAFGPRPDATEKLLQKSENLNASNVHIVNEPFLQSSSKDKIFKGVRGIICNPPCTLSGVVDMVEVVTEQGEKILPVVAKGPGYTSHLPRFVTTQYLTLKHALSFPKVNTVIYFTRSLHVQENEQVIRKVVDELSNSNDDSPFRLVSVDTSIRDRVLPESSFFESFVNLKNLPTDIVNKCLRVLPTNHLGGFFIAAFQRMPLRANQVLERAMERGTLGADIAKGGSKKNKRRMAKKAKMQDRDAQMAMEPTTASINKVRSKTKAKRSKSVKKSK